MMSAIRKAGLLVGLLLVAPVQVAASSPADVLERFYIEFNGDGWLHNDGWLQPGVSHCEWYGVRCWDNSEIEALILPGNNLRGVLHGSDIFMHVLKLDLGSNRITGRLPEVAPAAGVSDGSSLWYLDLSGNRLEGEVPSSWKDLRLLVLDLSGNRLEGMPEAAFHAMAFPLGSGHLNLADNRFGGELPPWVTDLDLLEHNQGIWGGGLNLCWNEFRRPIGDDGEDPVGDWIRRHHVGGDNADDCTSRERVAISPTISGSWYDPARSGEGLVVHLLDRDEPLLYWFTFDEHGEQRWLFQVGAIDEYALRWDDLLTTRGRFGRGHVDGDGPALSANGMLRLDRTGETSTHVERIYYEFDLEAACLLFYPGDPRCGVSSYSDRLEHIQLTRLAGTTCDNQHEAQWISGAWRSVDASGEGFIVEVLDDGRAVVYWFTYQPDDSGDQAWLIGEGVVDSADRIVIEDMRQPSGGGFGAGFDPDRVDSPHWGALALEFNDDRNGTVAWNSLFDEFGRGGYTIQRLTRPMLAESCGN